MVLANWLLANGSMLIVYESEPMGAWLAVSMVREMDYEQKIVVEGDSLSVIKDIILKGGAGLFILCC